MFLRNEPTVFGRIFWCKYLWSDWLGKKYAREFGGFVLENEPNFEGVMVGFSAAESAFRGVRYIRNGCGEDALAVWRRGKQRLRMGKEFSKNAVETILSLGLLRKRRKPKK